ncbi:flagellar hook basal-body protein [Methylobacterium sp. C25]|uniref:flagellar hook basal-body protein n=1 Tax=Methylobacterium sp. C25 TaxID=2721622 RepID=UPI001F1C2274|nr:flagellar hook basal-body protein [Methylobacterium sp. C25]MCE4225170.1 flagellar hook basal-body protein [Methylobacterium sp. C25]
MSLFDALSTSITGVSAQSYALNNISGNIANTSTVGFKSINTSFADMLAETQQTTDAPGGVSIGKSSTLGIQGIVALSGVPTNLAITGNGYFIVKQGTGTPEAPSFSSDTAYTRRGDFSPDSNGYLVNGAGYYLFAGPSATAPVEVDVSSASALSSLSVSSSGGLTANYADGSTQSLGSLTVAQFGSQDGLATLDGSAYVATSQSGAPTFGLDGAMISSGSVEQSNSDTADQFSKMIETQQAYTANTKVMSATNEMLQSAIAMYV